MLNNSTFKVHEVPVQMEGIVNSDDYKLIVRDDTSEVISCMTKDYRLVTNQEIMDKAMPLIERNNGTLTECKVFGNGARTNWTFQFKDQPMEIYDDTLYPQINIRNSYDGSLSVSILGGIYRLVCKNGAIIGKIMEQHSEKHSIWNPKISNGHIGDMVESTIDSMELVFKKEFPLLFNTKVTQKHIVEVLERLIPSQYNEDAVNYLLTHKPNSYWDLFNMCTWIYTHRANRDHESTHKFETESYHYVKKLAKAAS